MKQYLRDNAWVWAGTGLVLLTLSGSTLRMALIITVATVVIHSFFSYLASGDDE